MSGPVLQPRQRATTMTALLTWTFKIKQAHVVMGASLHEFDTWYGSSATAIAWMVDTGGVLIRGGGRQRFVLHPDAEELFMLTKKLLNRDEWLTVVWAALNEQPPDWGARVPAIRCAPIFRCPVQYLDQAAERERRRGQYRAWFLALIRLQHECQARPERFRDWYVESLGAQCEPWANGAIREIA